METVRSGWSMACISPLSFAGFPLRLVTAICLWKSKYGAYYVPVINAEHFLLFFLFIYISF